MNPQDKPEMKSYDEPLFVLKYRGYKVFLRVIFCSMFVFFLGVATFVLPLKLGVTGLLEKLNGGSMFFATMFLLIDLLLFKEIRLYRDKIVKIWRFVGLRTVELANARLAGKKIPPISVKVIWNQENGAHQDIWHEIPSPFHTVSLVYPGKFGGDSVSSIFTLSP